MLHCSHARNASNGGVRKMKVHRRIPYLGRGVNSSEYHQDATPAGVLKVPFINRP